MEDGGWRKGVIEPGDRWCFLPVGKHAHFEGERYIEHPSLSLTVTVEGKTRCKSSAVLSCLGSSSGALS